MEVLDYLAAPNGDVSGASVWGLESLVDPGSVPFDLVDDTVSRCSSFVELLEVFVSDVELDSEEEHPEEPLCDEDVPWNRSIAQLKQFLDSGTFQ